MTVFSFLFSTVHHKLNPIKELINFGLTGMNHLLGEIALQASTEAQMTIEINGFLGLKCCSNVVLDQ